LIVTSQATLGAVKAAAADIASFPNTVRAPVVLAMEPDA
jgi:hypothetical protein